MARRLKLLSGLSTVAVTSALALSACGGEGEGGEGEGEAAAAAEPVTLTLAGHAGFHPLQSVKETPTGTSGDLREAEPEISGRITAAYGKERWSVGLALAAALQQVQFRGDASSAFDPELTDVQISQTVYAVTLGASLAF